MLEMLQTEAALIEGRNAGRVEIHWHLGDLSLQVTVGHKRKTVASFPAMD